MAPVGAMAETVNVTAGSLGVTATIPADVNVLTLKGSVNAADLHYIAGTCTSLTALDLSGVTIKAYEGKKLAGNLVSSPANVLPAYQLSGLKAVSVTLPDGITAIGAGALMGSTVKSIAIPASVRTIGLGAFADCKEMMGTNIPVTVDSVASNVFSGCTSLRTVSWASAAPVPASAFAGCKSLSNVTLNADVASIGEKAFVGTSSLAKFVFPTSLRSIGDEAFAFGGLTEANLSGCTSLMSVGDYAFARCYELTAVRLPEQLGKLSEGIFFDDAKLAAVSVGPTVKVLPALAFKGNRALLDVSPVLKEGIDSIGQLAMQGLDGVDQAVLPSSLVHIDNNAFEGWTGLKKLDGTALKSVPTLGEDVWAGVDQKNVTLDVPKDMEDAFLAADQWKEFSISRSETTGIAGGVTKPYVRVKFDGPALRIVSSERMVKATLHDLNGIVLLAVEADGATELTLDTAPYQSPLFILTITFEDGTDFTAKLLRK